MALSLDFYLLCVAVAVTTLLVASLSLFVLRKARNQKANGVLGILMLLLGVSFLSDILFANHFFERYPHLYDYDAFLTLSLGPLLYFYILLQTRPDFRFRPVHLLHVASLIVYFLILWQFFTSNAATKQIYLKKGHWLSAPHYQWAYYFKVMQLLLYGIVCYQLLLRHNRVIEELVASVENRQLKWLRNLLLAAAWLFVVWVLSNQIMIVNEINAPNFPLGIALLLFSYWVAYHSLSQEYVFEKISTPAVLPIIQEDPDVRYRNSPLSQQDIKRLMEQLEQHMRQAKPYLDSELTLTALADQLQWNPKHLSQVLNEGFSENFYKFVSRYRIEASKELLRDSLDKYNILGIAYQSGFKSKSTFNKTFRELTGCSPSEFVKGNQS